MALTKVFSVDTIDLKITQTTPSWLIIHSTGRVSSTGWSDGQILKRDQVAPPIDGMLNLEFQARPPAASSLNVLTTLSASIELANIGIPGYWGPGKPLKGVRVHALSNAKTVEIVGVAEAARLNAEMSPRVTEAYVAIIDNHRPLSFEQDIKPLFRPRDVRVMERLGGFNLHKYEDVKRKADRILEKLNVDMPCDGLWPPSDIAKFKKWKDDDGMPA